MRSKTLEKESTQLMIVLAAFVALGPLSTDMYLPALPALTTEFSTDAARVQLTLGTYLAGFSFFHLVCGPLSDSYGRKPVLLCGFVVFLLSSIACTQASTISELIAWRFIQGAAACVGPTLGRAMIRDMYQPSNMARAMAHLAAMMALAPVLAPLLGGWMLLVTNWQAIFWFLALYAGVSVFMLKHWVPESLAARQSFQLRRIAGNYLQLLRSRQYMVPVIGASFLYSGAFAFLVSSSFILIDFMGVPPDQFGYWFIFMVLGYIAGNLLTGRYAQTYADGRLMKTGALLGLLASALLAVLAYSQIYHPMSVILPFALYTCAVGIALPQAMADALNPFPEMAGTASALMGFFQMGVAALAAGATSLVITSTPEPLAWVLCCCSGVSVLFFLVIRNDNV